MSESLSKLSESLIHFFEQATIPNTERKITVNPVVSKVVSWYEKFRNAMEYHEEEVIIRASIERILRRRLLLGGSGATTAEPLVRELIWGGYFPDDTVPQSAIQETEEAINSFLALRHEILKRHKFRESTLNEWMYHFMSCKIENILNPSRTTVAMGNFMFQIMKNQISIADDSEQVRDVQVYIAVRKAFHRDDLAFLRYHLFVQYFGDLHASNLSSVAEHFIEGYREINSQLKYKKKETIYNYVRKKAPVFLILEDVLKKNEKDIKGVVTNLPTLQEEVFAACNIRYKSIKKKVRTAIVRSVIFILCTKVIFAFAVEGTYEKVMFGKVLWNSIVINTSTPPILMIVVSFFIKTPGLSNSKRILDSIQTILYREDPKIGSPLVVRIKDERKHPLMTGIFTVLWLFAFLITFGAIFYLLSSLHFNIVSQFVFVFFLTVVSFLSYRISLVAHLYSIIERQSIGTLITDFFFLPIVRVGQQLAQSVQSINFVLYIFDFVIETPFKAVFAFFEQWFGFLHAKREELG